MSVLRLVAVAPPRPPGGSNATTAQPLPAKTLDPLLVMASYYGYSAVVSVLLETHRADPNARNMHGAAGRSSMTNSRRSALPFPSLAPSPTSLLLAATAYLKIDLHHRTPIYSLSPGRGLQTSLHYVRKRHQRCVACLTCG